MALRLHVRLKRPADVEIINAPLPPVKGHADERSLRSDELYTPAGLPLQFHSHFRGDWGNVVVTSADVVLLRLSMHVNGHTEMRLPAEEVMELSVQNY